MSRDATIRDYTPADEAAVLRLLDLAHGGVSALAQSGDFFRWKHVGNPFGPSIVLLAENSKEVIGVRAFLRWRFRAAGATIQAVRAVDTATHPAHQRMGVFSRLTMAAIERARGEGIRFVFNTPSKSSIPGNLKLGWVDVGKPTLMVRPARPLCMARSFLPVRRAQDGAAQGNGWLRPVDSLLALDEQLADLLTRDDEALAGGIRTARSVAYLRWRYARIPSLRYSAHWVSDSRMRAAVIYRPRRTRRGLRELRIAELFFADRRAGWQVLRELLSAVQADYATAHCAASAPHRLIFWWAGFVPAPWMGPRLVTRGLAPGKGGCDPATAAHWRLSLGDLEVF